ncbi:MAG: ABC transporter ATP-binding protein [Henriciella sp.]
MLLVEKLTKSFSQRQAVSSVSLQIEKGEVIGFLGQNGAGKSTTLRMICGAIEPDQGDARIAGYSIVRHRRQAQRLIGYLPEGAPLYPDMRVTEFLNFMADCHQLQGSARQSAIDRVITDTRLSSALGQTIATLSKGFKRRVGLAGALLHDPPALILDEPLDGLDPIQRSAVKTLISTMAPDKAVLISTHNLDDIPAMCSRTIIIDHGRVIADETPDALARRGAGSLETAFAELVSETARVTH